MTIFIIFLSFRVWDFMEIRFVCAEVGLGWVRVRELYIPLPLYLWTFGIKFESECSQFSRSN